MPTITVYPFTIYDPKQDRHERAKGMATEKMIQTIPGSTVIYSESKQIDDSDLTQSGRYHDLSQEETD